LTCFRGTAMRTDADHRRPATIYHSWSSLFRRILNCGKLLEFQSTRAWSDLCSSKCSMRSAYLQCPRSRWAER
jgi:hypothetical protein